MRMIIFLFLGIWIGVAFYDSFAMKPIRYIVKHVRINITTTAEPESTKAMVKETVVETAKRIAK